MRCANMGAQTQTLLEIGYGKEVVGERIQIVRGNSVFTGSNGW